MNHTAPIMIENKMPVRRGNLGEDRVLKPFPLDTITIIGMGATAIQFTHACVDGYYTKAKREQIWTINNAGYAFNCDMCFSIHDEQMMFSKEIGQGPEEGVPYLGDIKVPLVLAQSIKEYPTSLEFPLHEVFKEFQETYFDHTTPYMIAFALMCFALSDAPVKRLLMYGCDYNYLGNTAAEAGKACTEYWLGRARERGIEVYIPPQSSLLSVNTRRAMGIYGYPSMQPIGSTGEDGRINGIKEFVDPISYRLDKQVQLKLKDRLKFKGTEEEQMKQAEAALDIICRSFDINPLTLMAAMQGKAEMTVKPGSTVEI